jgi:hypothetical protein
MGGTYQGNPGTNFAGGANAQGSTPNSNAAKVADFGSMFNPTISHNDIYGAPVPLTNQQIANNIPSYFSAGNLIAKGILSKGAVPNNISLPNTTRIPVTRQTIATYPGFFGLGKPTSNVIGSEQFYQY